MSGKLQWLRDNEFFNPSSGGVRLTIQAHVLGVPGVSADFNRKYDQFVANERLKTRIFLAAFVLGSVIGMGFMWKVSMQ